GPSKRELVCGRLARRLRALQLASFAEYRALLDGPEGGRKHGELTNRIPPNPPGFFGETHHFDYLGREVLPALLGGSQRRLRIWSAACSSGEEPYSIAMTLHKALAGRAGWDARILATDIDTVMLGVGAAGCYDAERARAIPAGFANLVH